MAKQVLSDLDFNGSSKIINLPDGTAAQHPVTVAQLNAAIEGLAPKDNVVVAAQVNTTIAVPGASINAITMSVNDRVLLFNQTAGSENGIYIWNGAAVPMTRSLDMNSSLEFNSAIVGVDQGTSAGVYYRQTTVGPTVGTTAIAFIPFGVVAPAASETTAGIAELATQAETDAGTDDLRMVTPLKLKTSPLLLKKFSQTFGDGAATSYAINHNLNSTDVSIEVFKVAGNKDSILCEVQRTSVNQVTLIFSSAPASNALRVVVIS